MKNTYSSPFSLLGDISKYNYDQLCKEIVGMKSKVIENSGHKIVEWSDAFTVMTIRFNRDGTFNKILREEWRELNLVFDYNR